MRVMRLFNCPYRVLCTFYLDKIITIDNIRVKRKNNYTNETTYLIYCSRKLKGNLFKLVTSTQSKLQELKHKLLKLIHD